MKYGWHQERREPVECDICGVKPCINPRFCWQCRRADWRRRDKERMVVESVEKMDANAEF